MKAGRLTVGCIFFAAALSVSAAPPDAKFVDGIIKAYGGEPGWKKAAALRQTGTVVSAMQGEGRLVREWIGPDKLRIAIKYAASEESRVVNGLFGWRDGEPVQGPQLDAMILQCARISLPSLLISHRDGLVDLGDRERDGRRFRAIQIPLTTYMFVEIEVDPATHRIARSIGRAAVPGTAAKLEFAAAYDDFRDVDGLLFAFREENWASGYRTGLTKLDKVEIKGSAPHQQ